VSRSEARRGTAQARGRTSRTRGSTCVRGFTLVEVLVALMIVALGLAALMLAVNGTASASGYLRDKAIAQWIALNRLTEVRLNLQQKPGQNGDTGELDMANRKWHYDTRYYDTSFASMHRVVVRVWAGPADQKGNPLGEYTAFLGTDLSSPGGSNVDWTQGSGAGSTNCVNGNAGTPTTPGQNPQTPSSTATPATQAGAAANCTPTGTTPSTTPTTNTATTATPTTNPQ